MTKAAELVECLGLYTSKRRIPAYRKARDCGLFRTPWMRAHFINSLAKVEGTYLITSKKGTVIRFVGLRMPMERFDDDIPTVRLADLVNFTRFCLNKRGRDARK